MKSVLYKGGVSASEGLAVRFHAMEKGHCTIQHWHEYCELEFVMSGSGLHQVGGSRKRKRSSRISPSFPIFFRRNSGTCLTRVR